MSVLDLINRVFGRDIASRTVAKERLRLVLVHDRSSVSPQLMEHLKEDLLQVISQYMEIDPDGFDVTCSQRPKTRKSAAWVASSAAGRSARSSSAVRKSLGVTSRANSLHASSEARRVRSPERRGAVTLQ